jgi:signal transduction histidine kinase
MPKRREYILGLFFLFLFFFNTAAADSIQKAQKEQYKFATALLDSAWKIRSESPSLAISLATKVLTLIKQNDLTELTPQTLNYIGIFHEKLGNYSTAFSYFEKALSSAKLFEDSLQMGYTYNNFAEYYISKASYSLALENALLGYQIFRKLGHNNGLAYSLYYLGEIFLQNGNYKKALEYFNESATLREASDDYKGYSKTIMQIGKTYYKLGMYDKALSYLFSAIKLNNKIGFLKGNSYVISLISDINYAKGKYRKARNQLLGALKTNKQLNNTEGIITDYNRLGLVYLKLGNYSTAKETIEEAIRLAKKTGLLDQEMEGYRSLSKYYAIKKDYKSAYNYLTKYITLKDSIYGQEHMGRLADLQTLFATKEKEIENKFLKRKIEFEKRNNTYLVIISIIILLVVILLVSKYKAQNRANNLLKELNSSKDKFFSILAHDLRNPFQGLLGYTEMLKEDFEDLSREEAKESVNSLYNLSRNVYNLLEGLLSWSRVQTGRIEYTPTLFQLNEEVNKAINLLSENAARKNITLVSSVDNSIMVYADRNMIYTIFRNLIANAIKFSHEKTEVKITAEKKQQEVEIAIIDHGIGISEESMDNLFRIDVHHTTLGTDGEEGTGVGLILCYELVKKNKGKIWVESELGKGSKFIFTLPSSKK